MNDKGNSVIVCATRGTTANVFGDDAIEQFARNREQQTGVQVAIVRPKPITVT